jgi:oligopeptide transport system substrate-binding protein
MNIMIAMQNIPIKKCTKNNLFAILLIVLAYVIIGCNHSNLNNTHKKVFHYNESKDIATLDPAYARNLSKIWPVNQLFNGLLQLDDSLQIKSCIAKKWVISQDGRIYTFHLRNDVFFHDNSIFKSGKGRKVIASDFVYSFNRLIDPAIASPGAWVFNFVNIKEPNTTKGFVAVNDSTFQIYLKSSFPAFLGLLTIAYCFVVPKEVVTYYGRDFRNHPVGTGPFKFKLWIEGEKLIMIKNDNYFEKDINGIKLPKIDGISISFIADKQSEFLEFIKGRIDFISGVNAAFKDELITPTGKIKPAYRNKFNMLICPYLNTEYLGILVDTSLEIVRKSPLHNKFIRQAINLSIDRKKMISNLRNNIGLPANAGFIPKGLPSFSASEVHGYKYDPDSARKLLVKAGYPGGKGLIPTKIITVSDYSDICEYVQHELEKVGIPIEIEVVTGLSYREMIANSRTNMFRASWVADYPDAENYLALFYGLNLCPKGPNYTRFKNESFDKLYELSLREQNNKKRYKLYNQMDQIIIDEALTIPLYYDVAIRFTQKNIYNLGINPMNNLILKYVEIR